MKSIIVECCGRDVVCNAFTNTCPTCGQDYGWTGMALAPRDQWDGTDGARSPGYC